MARQEQDREDLLAQATALVERASLRVKGRDEEIIVGFRRDGGASFYFGAARAYQFSSDGPLRRAFVGELLFKAEAGKLVALRRRRTEHAVELVRDDLDAEATRAFLDEMQSHLGQLHRAIVADGLTLVAQIPSAADVLGRIRAWLHQFARCGTIARSPRAS
jgi:hypothetical protein